MERETGRKFSSSYTIIYSYSSWKEQKTKLDTIKGFTRGKVVKFQRVHFEHSNLFHWQGSADDWQILFLFSLLQALVLVQRKYFSNLQHQFAKNNIRSAVLENFFLIYQLNHAVRIRKKIQTSENLSFVICISTFVRKYLFNNHVNVYDLLVFFLIFSADNPTSLEVHKLIFLWRLGLRDQTKPLDTKRSHLWFCDKIESFVLLFSSEKIKTIYFSFYCVLLADTCGKVA